MPSRKTPIAKLFRKSTDGTGVTVAFNGFIGAFKKE